MFPLRTDLIDRVTEIVRAELLNLKSAAIKTQFDGNMHNCLNKNECF